MRVGFIQYAIKHGCRIIDYSVEAEDVKEARDCRMCRLYVYVKPLDASAREVTEQVCALLADPLVDQPFEAAMRVSVICGAGSLREDEGVHASKGATAALYSVIEISWKDPSNAGSCSRD
jgi:hypothetical protein